MCTSIIFCSSSCLSRFSALILFLSMKSYKYLNYFFHGYLFIKTCQRTQFVSHIKIFMSYGMLCTGFNIPEDLYLLRQCCKNLKSWKSSVIYLYGAAGTTDQGLLFYGFLNCVQDNSHCPSYVILQLCRLAAGA